MNASKTGLEMVLFLEMRKRKGLRKDGSAQRSPESHTRQGSPSVARLAGQQNPIKMVPRHGQDTLEMTLF